MWKKFAVAVILILAIFAFLPMVAVDILSRFALGWMIVDIVNSIFDYNAIGKGAK